MPRNKSVKRANKRQTANKILVSVQKMEMDLLQMPSELAGKLDKEINAHKKQEIKLSKALNKSQKQMMSAESRLQSIANKAKAGSAGKKQLKKAKKMHDAAAEIHAALVHKSQAVNNTLEALLEKQSKFTAIAKTLNQFNKEWSKSAKEVKAKAKVKSKPEAKKIRSKNKSKSAPAAIKELHISPVDANMDHSKLDEVTELAS